MDKILTLYMNKEVETRSLLQCLTIQPPTQTIHSNHSTLTNFTQEYPLSEFAINKPITSTDSTNATTPMPQKFSKPTLTSLQIKSVSLFRSPKAPLQQANGLYNFGLK